MFNIREGLDASIVVEFVFNDGNEAKAATYVASEFNPVAVIEFEATLTAVLMEDQGVVPT
jgi:hypothetical protein